MQASFKIAHSAGGRQPTRAGFTLLELVIACSLLAVLMATSVRILRSLLRDSGPLMAGAAGHSEGLARQIRSDLHNARAFRRTRDAVELLGYNAQDRTTGQPLLTPAVVRYVIAPVQSGSLLLRQQTQASSGWQQSTSQPLWLGVAEFRLRSTYLDSQETALAPALAALIVGQAGWERLPPSLQVQLLGTQGQTLYSQEIVRGSIP